LAPAAPPPNPAILVLSTREPAMEARFLVLLAPARSEPDARTFVSAARAIDVASWLGFESHGRTEDLVLFRKGARGQEAAYAGWSTDAAAWLARRGAGGDTLLAAQSVTTLKRDGHILFACDKPASFAADYRTAGIELTISAAEPAKARIARADGTLAELSIPPGQHNFTVR